MDALSFPPAHSASLGHHDVVMHHNCLRKEVFNLFCHAFSIGKAMASPETLKPYQILGQRQTDSTRHHHHLTHLPCHLG